jgi:hypothetical protein
MWRKDGCYTRPLAPRMSDINAKFCNNFCNTCLAVSKNHCFSTLHVLFICGREWPSLSACTTTGSAALKHFDEIVHLIVANISVRSWQPTVDGFLPVLFLQLPRNARVHIASHWCKNIQCSNYD